MADRRCGEVVRLGKGTCLGVPRLDAVDCPRLGSESYGSLPPETAGTLCRPLAVARLIACGMSLLRGEA
ncbi:hypothetical protein GCM10010238_17540 [Streptomyces griseoviridis]|uniref:Uncharacterized protein n=2 Tax=Streptomyces griseoviridis TaxID=45398 RepID=A0A918GD81_STRGD|nr:hypothetical protein [Streptomyces griseoviridis]GGS29214.1 hypothetical protein GCM10010238_17540 [Streptomyces niveoruber]GGS81235.1 hypothetical protein GCM10010240_13180 [Streptomyces griseoviridis]